MKHSPFRHWLHELWLQNKDEHADYHESILAFDEYFRRYKWWLKREYRFQNRK